MLTGTLPAQAVPTAAQGGFSEGFAAGITTSRQLQAMCRAHKTWLVEAALSHADTIVFSTDMRTPDFQNHVI